MTAVRFIPGEVFVFAPYGRVRLAVAMSSFSPPWPATRDRRSLTEIEIATIPLDGARCIVIGNDGASLRLEPDEWRRRALRGLRDHSQVLPS